MANFYLEICCKPPLKIRTLVVASPPADFPEGPHLDPTWGKTIKMTICFSTLFLSRFHNRPLWCRSDIIVRPMSSISNALRARGVFAARHWILFTTFSFLFLAIGFSVLGNLMLGWCICIVFVFSLASSQATDAIFCVVHSIFIS